MKCNEPHPANHERQTIANNKAQAKARQIVEANPEAFVNLPPVQFDQIVGRITPIVCTAHRGHSGKHRATSLTGLKIRWGATAPAAGDRVPSNPRRATSGKARVKARKAANKTETEAA